MFNFAAAMGPTESQFVRVYVAALRRDYDLVRSVLDLMSPDGLGLKNFSEAVTVAAGLRELQSDFDAKINRAQKKHKMRKIAQPTHPSAVDILDLFSLSFFKIMTTVKKETVNNDEQLVSEGWYSGKPTEWKKTVYMYKDVPKDNNWPAALGDIFSQVFKFFLANKPKWDMPPPGMKKIWPPANSEDNDGLDWFVDEDDDNDMY